LATANRYRHCPVSQPDRLNSTNETREAFDWRYIFAKQNFSTQQAETATQRHPRPPTHWLVTAKTSKAA
jgi:hypothetical protein